MTFVLPKLIQTPSPNFSERSSNVDLVVVHDCEGNYEGSVAWFANPKSQVSAHLVLDSTGLNCTQMAPLSKKAWHACAYNSRAIGVEMAGYSKTGFPDSELNADAAIIAWCLRAFKLPPRWAKGGLGPGFCSHYDLGVAGGGHSDPTTNVAVWQGYVQRIEAAYQALASTFGPWAIIDATPTEIVPPPAAPAGFTPSGTERSDEPPAWPDFGDPFFALGARVWNQWHALGYTNPECNGLTARAELECTFRVVGPFSRGDNNTAGGLYQWHADRKATIFLGCGIDVWNDPQIEHHVKAADWELNHTERVALIKIANTTNANDAGQAVAIWYERASALMAPQKTGAAAERWAAYLSTADGQKLLADNPPQA